MHHLEEIISQMRLAAVELHDTHDIKHKELEQDNAKMKSMLDASQTQQSNLKKNMQQQNDQWKNKDSQLRQTASDSKAEAKRAKKENTKLQSEMAKLRDDIKRDALRMVTRKTQFEDRIGALEEDLKDARSKIAYQVSADFSLIVVSWSLYPLCRVYYRGFLFFHFYRQ